MAQMSVVPSTHCVVSVTTLEGTSSLQHFLSNLHAMIFVVILVATSLICLIMILRNPLSVPYFFFISSASTFSFVLSSSNCASVSPSDGSSVLYVMRSTSIEKIYSKHRYPLWVTSINFLVQLFACWPSQSVGCPTGLES
jgi:ABC-type Fe3+-siderophore transport system permease subunit